MRPRRLAVAAGALVILAGTAAALPGARRGGASAPPSAGAVAGSTEAPDTLRLRRSVTRLAGQELRGRRSGEPGNLVARGYLAAKLAGFGLEAPPEAPGFRQSFAIAGEELASNRARLLGPEGREVEVWLSAAAPMARDSGTRLRAWPEGEPAPRCEDLEILVRVGPSGHGFFSPSALRDEAAAAGAGALILVPHPDDARGLYARYAGRAPDRDRRLHALPGDAPERPLAYAEPEQAGRLFTGNAPVPGPWRLELPGATALEFRLPAENLIARLPGGDAAGGVLLLVAHHDHLGVDPEGRIFPGADDNASGVAVLLELARLLAGAELPFELRFLFSDAEELGVLGARAYLAAFGPPARVLNLDSVGRAGVESYRELRTPGAASETLVIQWRSAPDDGAADALAAALATAGLDPRPGEGAMFALGGDHRAFAAAGVPSGFLFGGFHLDYNTPDDLPERVLVGRLGRLVAGLREWVLGLDRP